MVAMKNYGSLPRLSYIVSYIQKSMVTLVHNFFYSNISALSMFCSGDLVPLIKHAISIL